MDCLFSMNVDGEMFQYLIVRIENTLPQMVKMVKFNPSPLPWLRHYALDAYGNKIAWPR